MREPRRWRRRDVLRLMLAAGAGVVAEGWSGMKTTAAAPAAGTAILSRRIPSSGEPLPVIGLGTWQTHPVDFIQINYSVGEREAERRLLPLAMERRVAVIANRPFAGGDLFRRLRGRPLPAWAAEIDCDSWAQVLLKFVVSHPAITCAIPATSRVDHLRDNMKAGTGRLPDAALRARIAAEVA